MSQKVVLPYGVGETQVEIPERNLIGVVKPRDLPPLGKPSQAIAEVLANPLKKNTLLDLAQKGSKIVVLTSDIMRPGDYRRSILPTVLEQLKVAGVQQKDITILDAVGCHQMNTEEQWATLYGDQIPMKYRIINNNSRDKMSMVNLGKSELGDSVIVNKLVVESDLCIGIGAIQPAVPTGGYSGGVKIFAIGAASIETIFETHRAKIYWHPTSRSGIVLGNKFREHIESVGKKVLKESNAEFFTVDAVTNSKNEMIGVFAGDSAEVYREGCKLADKQWKVSVRKEADIVIAAVDHPRASNPYEMNISMSMVTRYPSDILKTGGVLIFVGICDSPPAEDSPSFEFLRLMRYFYDADDILDEVKRHQEREEAEQPTLTNFLLQSRVYGTALMLKNYSKVLIAGPKLPGLVRDMHFVPVKTVQTAFETALRTMGRNAEVLVVPRARSSIAYVG